MTAALHPFDRVPMSRIEAAHPRFLFNLDVAKLRQNIERQREAVNAARASQHLGRNAK